MVVSENERGREGPSAPTPDGAVRPEGRGGAGLRPQLGPAPAPSGASLGPLGTSALNSSSRCTRFMLSNGFQHNSPNSALGYAADATWFYVQTERVLKRLVFNVPLG